MELEITESVVVRESLRAADLLNQLRQLGISIAIDDFGVGYSSFAYLRELPVDRFKLDRSFLCSVPQSDADSRVVSAPSRHGTSIWKWALWPRRETAEQATFLKRPWLRRGPRLLPGPPHARRPICRATGRALPKPSIHSRRTGPRAQAHETERRRGQTSSTSSQTESA